MAKTNYTPEEAAKKHERSNLPIIWQPLLWPIVALYAAVYAVCWVRAKWAGE